MGVRFFRECFDGQWTDLRLSDEEIVKLRIATVKSGIKCLKVVRDVVAEASADKANPVLISPADISTLAKAITPKYADVVSDYIRGKVWAKTHPATPATPAPAAAAK